MAGNRRQEAATQVRAPQALDELHERERELVMRFKETREERALESLFKMNDGLLRRLAGKYKSSLLPFPDAYQVASVGLLKALRRYDPDRGTSFRTYAYPNIEGELKKYYRDHAEMIRVPRRVWKTRNKIRTAEERTLMSTGERLSMSQIANRTGYGEDEILEANEADNFLAPVSIDRPVYPDGGFRLLSILGTNDPRIDELDDRLALEEAIADLPDNLRRVIELRIQGGRTQVAVARELNISQMQVSRLQRKACGMIREYIFRESGATSAN